MQKFSFYPNSEHISELSYFFGNVKLTLNPFKTNGCLTKTLCTLYPDPGGLSLNAGTFVGCLLNSILNLLATINLQCQYMLDCHVDIVPLSSTKHPWGVLGHIFLAWSRLGIIYLICLQIDHGGQEECLIVDYDATGACVSQKSPLRSCSFQLCKNMTCTSAILHYSIFYTYSTIWSLGAWYFWEGIKWDEYAEDQEKLLLLSMYFDS